MTTPRKKYRSRREKAKTLKRVTELQAERRAGGLCLDCGQTLSDEERTSGRTRCFVCRDRRADRARERRETRRPTCRDCRAPLTVDNAEWFRLPAVFAPLREKEPEGYAYLAAAKQRRHFPHGRPTRCDACRAAYQERREKERSARARRIAKARAAYLADPAAADARFRAEFPALADAILGPEAPSTSAPTKAPRKRRSTLIRASRRPATGPKPKEKP